MFVKVMRGGLPSSWRLDEVPRFEHVVVSELLGDGDYAREVIGLQVEICYKEASRNIVIQLPRDGDVIYFENDAGDTTAESVRWPIPPSRRRLYAQMPRTLRITEESKEAVR